MTDISMPVLAITPATAALLDTAEGPNYDSPQAALVAFGILPPDPDEFVCPICTAKSVHDPEIHVHEATRKRLLKQAVAERKVALTTAKTGETIAKAARTVAETTAAVKTQLARVAVIEKMPAPGGPTRSRTPDMVIKSSQRDSLDLEVATLERQVRETHDPDIRAAHAERLADVRARLSDITKGIR